MRPLKKKRGSGIIYLLTSLLFISSTIIEPFFELEGAFYDSASQIIWLAETQIFAAEFPVAIKSNEGHSVQINTSWGLVINKTINQTDLSGSEFFGVKLPSTTTGTGNLSICTDNSFYDNYQVEWRRLANPDEQPISFSFKYIWFSYWVGETHLQANFFKNNTLLIKHSIIKINELNPSTHSELPYNQNFTLRTILSDSEWSNFSSLLLENDAINWLSWNYTPSNTNYGDRGGWKKELTINWNLSFNTEIKSIVDDDSGSNQRLLVNPLANELQNLILDYVTNQVDNYLAITSRSTSGITLIFQIIFLTIFICLKRGKRLSFNR